MVAKQDRNQPKEFSVSQEACLSWPAKTHLPDSGRL